MTGQPSFLPFNRRNTLVYLIYFISLCWLAFLVSSIQPGVFFSSDGGMKFMIVRQIDQGHGFKYLYLPQPQWVHEIWNSGYFPFSAPFVYPSARGYLFAFPAAFQIINAFFYSQLGYAGLYILPIASAVLLWLFMIILLNYCHIAPSRIAIAIFMLVFCSPLTIYGATYWEHMPAVLLLFIGLAFIIKPPAGPLTAIIQGFLCGLAIWLRPEGLVMDIMYALAVIILYLRKKRPVYPFFLIGMFLSVASFFVFNKMEYGSFFGIHGYQVFNEEGNKLLKGIKNMIAVNKRSIHYFPFVLLLIPLLFRFPKFKIPLDLRSGLLVSIVIGYCLLTPFVLPNEGGRQWGARYFLPIIPIVIIALLLIEEQWKRAGNRRLPLWLTAAIIICAGYSCYLNSYKGGIKTLRWENYNRIKPSLDFIKQNGSVVVIREGYIAMEMAYAFNEKYFFVADNDTSLNKLMILLKKQGIHEFTYVYDVNSPKGLPDLIKNSTPTLSQKGDFSFLKYIIR